MDSESRNTASVPDPVVSTVEEQQYYWDKLPKQVRLAASESNYEYNAKMIWGLFDMLIGPTYELDRATAIRETVKQIAINDAEFKKKAMQEWKIPMPPTTSSSSKRPNSPMKRTASTVKRAAIIRSSRGLKQPKTSAIPQGMVFDLFGTELKRLKTRTPTG